MSAIVTPTTLNEFGSYEILGRGLEPSTTYVVSVTNQIDLSGKFSDSSEEREFTTRKCHLFRLLLLLMFKYSTYFLDMIRFLEHIYNQLIRCNNGCV